MQKNFVKIKDICFTLPASITKKQNWRTSCDFKKNSPVGRCVSRVARFWIPIFLAYLVASCGWPWNRREVVYPKNTTAASSHRSLKIAWQPHAEAAGGAAKSNFSLFLFLSPPALTAFYTYPDYC